MEWNKLRQIMRDYFFHGSLTSTMKYAKASSWYQFAYNRSSAKNTFLSFPWIVSDVLSDMKRSRMTHTSIHSMSEPTIDLLSDISIYKKIGRDAFNGFLSESMKLMKIINRRKVIFSNIKKEILSYTSKCNIKSSEHIYGSLSLGLCEEGSDIDIYVELPESPPEISFSAFLQAMPDLQDREKYMIERYLFPCFDAFANRVTKVFDTTVPILKCYFGHDESEILTQVDICINKGG